MRSLNTNPANRIIGITTVYARPQRHYIVENSSDCYTTCNLATGNVLDLDNYTTGNSDQVVREADLTHTTTIIIGIIIVIVTTIHVNREESTVFAIYLLPW